MKPQERKYQIIYADPPWPIRWVTVPTVSGFKGLDYPTMAIAEMCNLPIKDISEECSKCFVWTTNHFLMEGLFLIRSWGFQFDKLWVWCKKTGAGGHPRTATEYVIEGTRGLLKSIGQNEKATNNWFIASKGKHSVKPEIVRDMINQFYPNYSKIELFARRRALGWDCWGNEVESDIELGSKESRNKVRHRGRRMKRTIGDDSIRYYKGIHECVVVPPISSLKTVKVMWLDDTFRKGLTTDIVPIRMCYRKPKVMNLGIKRGKRR